MRSLHSRARTYSATWMPSRVSCSMPILPLPRGPIREKVLPAPRWFPLDDCDVLPPGTQVQREDGIGTTGTSVEDEENGLFWSSPLIPIHCSIPPIGMNRSSTIPRGPSIRSAAAALLCRSFLCVSRAAENPATMNNDAAQTIQSY